jgi:hypothetical protein
MTTVAPGHSFALRGTLAAGQTLTADSGAPGYPAGGLITDHTNAVNQGTIDLLAGPGYRHLSGATAGTLRVTGTLANTALITADGGSNAHGHYGSVTGAAVEIAHTGTVLNTGTIAIDGALHPFYGYHGPATLAATGALLRDNGTLTNTGALLISGSSIRGHDSGGTAVIAGLLNNSGLVQVSAAPGYDNRHTGRYVGRGGIVRVDQTGTIVNAGTIKLGPQFSYGLGSDGILPPGAATLQVAGQMMNGGVLDIYTGGGQFGGSYHYDQGSIGVVTDTGTLSNTGTIVIFSGYDRVSEYSDLVSTPSTLTNNGVLTNTGLIKIAASGDMLLDNGSLGNSGTFEITGGLDSYYLHGSGGIVDVAGTATNSGMIQVQAGSDDGPPYISPGGTLSVQGALTNTGTITVQSSPGSYGGSLTVAGVLTNEGKILLEGGSASAGATARIGGTLTNLGTLACNAAAPYPGSTAATIALSGLLIDPGAITGAGTIANTGTLTSGAPGVTTGAADPTIVNAGTIEVAASGAFSLSGPISGAGQISIETGGRLTLGASAAAGQLVDFAGTTTTLALADPAGFYATIEGLRPQTTIDFLTTAITSAHATGTTLALGLAAGGTLDVTLAAPLAAYATLSLTSDLHGGTDLTVTVPPPPAPTTTPALHAAPPQLAPPAHAMF